MTPGRLFAVVGPSGAGKDTLIAAVGRARPDLHIARRAITRPEAPGPEPFESVSEAEFADRRARGAFALWWRAHGLGYGVPVAIDAALAEGRDAAFNGSRAVIGAARARYPGLRILAVTAPPETLAARLAERRRETAAEIEARLRRAGYAAPEGPDVVTIDNGGALDEAVAACLAALQPERA